MKYYIFTARDENDVILRTYLYNSGIDETSDTKYIMKTVKEFMDKDLAKANLTSKLKRRTMKLIDYRDLHKYPTPIRFVEPLVKSTGKTEKQLRLKYNVPLDTRY
jgi:hypothetical protein